MKNEVYFRGQVERIIYQNSANFFKVLLLDIDDTDFSGYRKGSIIVAGECADILEGEEYIFFGEVVDNPKYGEQLKISRYERGKINHAGMVKYLSSKRFKGVGKKKAEKIIQLYKDDDKDVIDAIIASPEKLTSISGLSEKNRLTFVEQLKQDYAIESTLSKLYNMGVPHSIALRIEMEHKEASVRKMAANPYLFSREIKGFSFSMADVVAGNLGIAVDSTMRINAAVLHVLFEQCMRTGDTYITRPELEKATVELLEKTRHVPHVKDLVVEELDNLIDDEAVQCIDDKIFDNGLYFAEEGIYRNLMRLVDNGVLAKYPISDIEQAISDFEREQNITYDDVQKQAIVKSITEPFFILTGGPGTGKTTVIRCIIYVYCKLHHLTLHPGDESGPIMLAAPTGRAARRVNEMTNLYSATLHRHLGLPDNYIDDDLDAKFIIVDEFSMVDTWLANQFFKKVGVGTQLLIVGDAGQLPSVSPGNVLSDLLKVDALPSITLEKVFRQSDDSTIVTLAADVRHGVMSSDFTDKKKDRSYIEASAEQVGSVVPKVLQAALNSGVKAKDVQILAPMYKGDAGINNLNLVVQEMLNPKHLGDLEFKSFNNFYRIGDRVIHLENKPDLGVFNGDLGYIVDLTPADDSESRQDEILMDFDGILVRYPRSEWELISLAYAMSIHKSQGSEFKVVIMPITYGSYMMLQRNLVYTGITRAKDKLILIGEKKAFSHAIEKVAVERKTYLVQRFS